jgi:hypothetical protein
MSVLVSENPLSLLDFFGVTRRIRTDDLLDYELNQAGFGNDPTIAVASFFSRVAFNIARHLRIRMNLARALRPRRAQPKARDGG